MSTTLNTKLTMRTPSSIKSKVAPIVDQAIFLLKTTVVISATVLFLASAWV